MTDPVRDPPTPFGRTPNAEKYLLEADSLRRRQLRSALLHGSRHTWRDRRRVWPGALAGVILAAVIAAALAIHGTFQAVMRDRAEAEAERQRQQQEQERRQQELERRDGAHPAEGTRDGAAALPRFGAAPGPGMFRWRAAGPG